MPYDLVQTETRDVLHRSHSVRRRESSHTENGIQRNGPGRKRYKLPRLLKVRAGPGRPLDARNALDMIKRRAKAIGLPETTCNHTFRATGITAYLENGGTIEHAQHIANHESPKTTKLYDRTSDQITLDEVERIAI
jgi:integrase